MRKAYAGIAACALAVQVASAATIQNAAVESLGTSTVNVNLTAAGPVDWALWFGTGAAPDVTKAGGTAISDLAITLAGGVTYAASAVVTAVYDWSDGTPTATGTDVNPQDPRLTLNGDLVGTGSSLRFSVAGKTTPQTVSVWGIMRNVGVAVDASLAGAGTVTSQLARDGGNNNIWFYSVEFTADNPGDVLTLTVTPYDSASGTTQERLGIGAVAVEAEGFYALTVAGGTGSGSYANGAVVEIAALPVAGKVFDQWTGDTQHVASVVSSPTTVTMPAAPVSLAATYADAPTYTLTASVDGGNGTVSPASTNVVQDFSAEFAIEADAGYRIASVTTNGTPVAGLGLGNFSTSLAFVWNNVQSNGVLVATFTPQQASSLVMADLSAAILGSGANVNLTAAGPVDWAVWGNLSAAPLYYKADGSAIGTLAITQPDDVLYNSGGEGVTNLYTWTDGGANAPSATDLYVPLPRLVSTAASGNDLEGTGAKLALTVAGKTSLQTVKVWGTVWRCGARITASLDGSNVVAYVSRDASEDQLVWTYGISFRSDSPDDALTLVVEPYDSLLPGTGQERLGIGAVAVSEVRTSRGTPYAWLETYYSNLVVEADYEAVDAGDTDGDGFAGWEEYLAGTDPTDADSYFHVTAAGPGGGGMVLTWVSTPSASYSVSTNINLIYSAWGVEAANIAGQAGTTSYTTTVDRAAAFFKVELE